MTISRAASGASRSRSRSEPAPRSAGPAATGGSPGPGEDAELRGVVRGRGRGARARRRRPTGRATSWAWWGDPDADGPGVVTGSHLDSVPGGGAFDGPLGVVCGVRRARRAARATGSAPRARSASPASPTRRARGSAWPAWARGCSPARSTADRAAGLADADGRLDGRGRHAGGRDPGRWGRTRRRWRGSARSSSCTSSRARGAGRPRPGDRGRHGDLAARPLAARPARAGPTTRAPPAWPTATTRCWPSPVVVLAATGRGRAPRRRRHRAARCASPRTASTRSRRTSRPGWTPAARTPSGCAAVVADVAADSGRGHRGVVDRPHAVRRRRSRPGSPRCWTTRRCCPPGPGTTPASSPRRASRPRCSSCATRPGSRTAPRSTPRTPTALAGVDALTAVLRELAGGVTPRDRRLDCGRGTRWLPGRRSPATSRLDDRRRPVHRRQAGHRARRRPAAARRRAARVRQRALARLPPGAARAHARRRRHVLDLARADVRRRRPARPRLLPRPGPRRLRRDGARPGSRPSASSTTCTTAPAACRTPTRTPCGPPCAPPRPTPGIRLTLLDTCYLAGGFDDPAGRRPAALRRPRRRRLGRAGRRLPGGRRIGVAVHSVRAVPARRARRRRQGRRGPTRCTCTSPSSPPRTPRASPRHGLTPTGLLAAEGVLGPPRPRSTPPT